MDIMLGEAPMITGTWFNAKNNDVFAVKDSFFEDNALIIMTTDGRRINSDILTQYVQVSQKNMTPKEISAFKLQNAPQKPQQKSELPPEIAGQLIERDTTQQKSQTKNDFEDLMTDEDKKLLGIGIDPGVVEINNYSTAVPRPEIQLPEQKTTQEDEDDMLVRRLLKKTKGISLTCDVKWSIFPIAQMQMLNMMAVDPNKIADYYMHELDLQTIQDSIRKSIVSTIESKLEKASEVMPKLTVSETSQKPAKKTQQTKKTTKKK